MAFLRLPRFDQRNPAVSADGRFATFVLRTLNEMIGQVEAAINAIAAIPDIQTALQDLDSATQAAQVAADNAQQAADDLNAQSSLTTSYVTGLTITAADVGTNVDVNISGHSRVYGDGASVAVGAGGLLGLDYQTYYYIYYDDPARAGGAVAYQFTTNESDAAQTGDRHVVGAVLTPASGDPDSNGNPVRPPGSGTIQQNTET